MTRTLTIGVVTLLLLPCTALAQFKDLADLAGKVIDAGAEQAELTFDDVSEVQSKHLCQFASNEVGKPGLAERAKAVLVKRGVKAATKALNVDGVELPERIQSPCYAEVRLDYVERKSLFWAESVADAINKALQALEIDDQIEASRLFARNVGDKSVEGSDYVTIRKEIGRGLDMVEKGIQENEAINEVLLAEARGALTSAMTYGSEIIGWDQRLAEFMGENVRWTMAHAAELNTYKDHAVLLGKTFKSVQDVVSANRAFSTDESLLVQARAVGGSKVSRDNAAYETRLAADLDL